MGNQLPVLNFNFLELTEEIGNLVYQIIQTLNA
jgi:hypothetical protein